MEISAKQLLNKMEELVGKAKQANSEEMLKGYILAIQALCDVMVNEKPSNLIHSPLIGDTVKHVGNVQTRTTVPITEPVKMDDANGGSIFDF